MNDTTFSLHLIQVDCVEAQELDGDELYITLDDTRVWDARPFKMHAHPSQDNQISAFHFPTARRMTKGGWMDETAEHQDDMWVYSGLSGEHTIRLWDADRLTRHDLLGENPVSVNDAGHGNIQVNFERDGGRYRLTYRVEKT